MDNTKEFLIAEGKEPNYRLSITIDLDSKKYFLNCLFPLTEDYPHFLSILWHLNKMLKCNMEHLVELPLDYNVTKILDFIYHIDFLEFKTPKEEILSYLVVLKLSE